MNAGQVNLASGRGQYPLHHPASRHSSLTAVMTATRVLSLSSRAFLQTLNSTSRSRAEPDMRPLMRLGWEESLKQEESSEWR